ncbi:hypothetical protein [Kribbella italica]|uniref:Heme exporter protein D n=1 Tax=Kribbella italica TaxID=1540520 RepID=A0A7W9J2C6_9ACTN|nr:hypothetical protein [Kribbella italica]MBB5834054.1 heme exporter protein D [Kribbella italica]
MSKFLGFLLGIVVALAGPAAFGVLTADGGIELNAKEMALAYGIGALIFWAVVSYFSGAAALGAALTFGAMIYAVHWIPNRTTNFLNDVPGVTTGMIDGVKTYTLNGVVPILAVISLVYAVQLIVQSVRRRRRERAEAERRQREQELAQAQQEAEVAAVYAPPVAAEYPPAAADNRFQNFGNTSYDDLFDDEPAPVQPRSQADEHTMQFAEADARGGRETTAVVGAVSNDADETVQVAPERDEPQRVEAQQSDPEDTQLVAAGESPQADETQVVAGDQRPQAEETQVVAADSDATQQVPVNRDETQQVPVAEAPEAVEDDKDDEPPAAATPTAAGATAVGVSPAPAAPPANPPTQAAPPVEAPKAEEPKVEAPKPEALRPEPPQPAAPQPETPQPEAPKNHGQQSFVRPKEEVGQQYRERMDDPEDTGEFFVGQFRPAGA